MLQPECMMLYLLLSVPFQQFVLREVGTRHMAQRCSLVQGAPNQARKASNWGRRRMCGWGAEFATSPGQLQQGRLFKDDEVQPSYVVFNQLLSIYLKRSHLGQADSATANSC